MEDLTIFLLLLTGWVSIGLLNYTTLLFYFGLTNQGRQARDAKEVWPVFIIGGPIGTFFGLVFIVFIGLFEVYSFLDKKVPVSFDVSRVAWQAGYRVREWLRK